MDASTTPGIAQPFKVFYISAAKDKAIRKELDIHLASRTDNSLPSIATWHPDNVTIGQKTEEEINQQLDEADVILILTSPHYNADIKCLEYTRRALERCKQNGITVIPIYVSPAALNNNLKSITGFPEENRYIQGQRPPERDEIYEQIAQFIRDIAKNRPQPPPPPEDIKNPLPPTGKSGETTISPTSIKPKHDLPFYKRTFIIIVLGLLIAGSLVGTAYTAGYHNGYDAPHPHPPIINTSMVTNMHSNGPGSFSDIVEHAVDGEAIVFKDGLKGK